ncbi:MAG: tetratricopeptide repeat protein [Chlamydiota bacterium]
MSKKFCVLLIFLSGCHRVPDTIEPRIDYAVQDRYLQNLPSPFDPLTTQEKQEAWGRETEIGFGFAHQLDLYQAMTAFKRAQFLLPSQEKTRKVELDYEILLCYYFGKKYDDVVYTFEKSELRFADDSFPAFQDLMLILYDSYMHLGKVERADQIRSLIRYYYPETEEKLIISTALMSANIDTLETLKNQSPAVTTILTEYDLKKKSIPRAQWLNTVLPGAGYLYVGQKQTALTAFLLNGLFIGATYYFFHQGNIPAGIIFTSFEAGWYFGGIYGAGQDAKFYNERLYEKTATPIMNREGLFPLFMLQHAF